MRLQTPLIYITVLQVALVEAFREATGYHGCNVTLTSGADPSWDLSEIVWSIFSNSTRIATYRGKKTNIKRFYRFDGRLSLNIASGDLTINNLNLNDAMEYSVDLINTRGQDSANKIKLIVKRHLQKPTPQVVFSTSREGGCWVVLRCSSDDEDVNLSWEVKTPNVTVFNTHGRSGHSTVHSAFLNTTSDVIFNCTSSKNMEKASSVIIHKCRDDKPEPQPHPSPPRNNYSTLCVVGGFLGGSLTVLLIYLCGDKIRAAFASINGTTNSS